MARRSGELAYVLVGDLFVQAELYLGPIDSVERGPKRAGDDAVSPGGPPAVSSPVQASLPRRSDNILLQATATLNNALDGFELSSDVVGLVWVGWVFRSCVTCSSRV